MTQYPTWLANVVLVTKKDGNFSYPNIHILIDNCAKHDMHLFVHCSAGYHYILMDEEGAKKTMFIMPWGVYNHTLMPFGQKNVGATCMRSMTTMFHQIIHKEIEVYEDDVIIKSRES